MKITGEKLIDVVCDRLKFKNEITHDGNILNEIRKLTSGELNQIVSFGNVEKWHNDEIK